MSILEYNKWLETPFLKNSSLTIIVTSYHTVDYTIKLLESLKDNILKMPKVLVEVLVYEDHRENNLLQNYVENIDLKNWHYFAVPENNSTNDSMYGRLDGIKKATGKYLTFLDGDDLLTNQAFKAYLKSIQLLENNKKLLITRFGEILVKESERSNFKIDTKLKELSTQKHLDKLHDNYTLNLPEYISFSKKIHSFPFYMWNKVYRSSFLKNLKIYLEERYIDIQIWLSNASTGIVNIIGYIHFYGSETHLQQVIAKSRKVKDKRYIREQGLKEAFVKDYKSLVEKHHSNTLKNIFQDIEKTL